MLLCDILLHRRNFFVKFRFYFLHFFFHKIWSTLHSLIRVLRGERAFRVTLNATLIPFNVSVCFCYLKLLCKLKLLSTSFEVWDGSARLLCPQISHMLLFWLALSEIRRKILNFPHSRFSQDSGITCASRDELQQSTQMFLHTHPQPQLSWHLQAALSKAQCAGSGAAAALCKHCVIWQTLLTVQEFKASID